MVISTLMQSQFLSIDEDTVLSQVIGKIKDGKEGSALIFSKNKYLGIIDHKKLLRSDYDSTNTKINNFVKRTPILTGEEELIETAYVLFQSDAEYAPIEKENKILGVLTGLELINACSQLNEVKKMKIKNIKLLESAAVQKEEPLGTALDLMIDQHIDHLLVFDGKNLFGIISFQDILNKYLNWPHQKLSSSKTSKIKGGTRSAKADKSSWSSVPVENFSTNANLITISSSSLLPEAALLMKSKGIHGLIVMDKNKVKGLLTVKNILKAIGSLRYPENQNVFFVGLADLNLHPREQEDIKDMASREGEKIRRLLGHDFMLRLHFKEYEKDGQQQKYSIHLHIDSPGKNISVSEHDWNLETTLHKLFSNAKNLLKKELKKDTSR